MTPTTLIATLVLLFASTAPAPLVPPDALPETIQAPLSEAIQAHPLSAPSPRWSAEALAAWEGPWDLRPSLYDYRYVTW
jgi:hypothetical protein